MVSCRNTHRFCNPGWVVPIISIQSFTALRFCSNLHLPDFFLITKIGEFHGEVDGTMCPAYSCSWTRIWAACKFSLLRDHCPIHTGFSVFYSMGMLSGCSAMAPKKNFLTLHAVQVTIVLFSCLLKFTYLPADFCPTPNQGQSPGLLTCSVQV